jgi:hypothetical protein
LCHFGQLPGKSLRLWKGKDLSHVFFLNESLISKLYEYEAIFEQFFSGSTHSNIIQIQSLQLYRIHPVYEVPFYFYINIIIIDKII